MSARFNVRQAASALSRSRPAKRARNSLRLSLATTVSVKGSALPSRRAGLGAGEIDALQGFAFAFQRADLDDPAGAGCGRLDRTVLSHGLRLGAGRRIGLAKHLRAWLRGGRLDAGRTPSTPWPVPWPAGCGGIVRRLGPGLGGLLRPTSARRAGIALVIGVRRLRRAGGSKLHRAGLDLDRLDLDRLHRLGRARDCRNLLGLDDAAGQWRGFRLGLMRRSWPAAGAGPPQRPPAATALARASGQGSLGRQRRRR